MDKKNNRKNIVQFVLLFFILVVLPLGTVYYTRSGHEYFKVLIGEMHDYAKVPPFEMRTHRGEAFDREDMLHKYLTVVAFSSLEGEHAEYIARQFKKLHSNFDDTNDVRFLLFTLRPEQDSLPRMRAFAQKAGWKDKEQLLILTGKKADIYGLLAHTFKMPLNFATREKTKKLELGAVPPDIQSYPYFVYVDKEGIIKNYYDYKDDKSMARLVEQLALLLPSRTDDDPVLRRETEK